MKIYIGFSRRNMAFSKFLKWTERRPYSHCYIRYHHPFTGQDLILHAAGFSIHTLTFENFQKHGNIVVKEYAIDVKDRNKLREAYTFIYEVSGNPYGWIQLIGMGLVKIAGFFGKKIKNPLSDDTTSMVCSEFCAHVISKIGISIDLAHAEEGGPSWVDLTLQQAGLAPIEAAEESYTPPQSQ